MFVRIGPHIIRASQIVRVTNSEYHERGGRTHLHRRVIHLRNGHELYEYTLGLDEILEKLNKIGG